jgi:hypothetical protein
MFQSLMLFLAPAAAQAANEVADARQTLQPPPPAAALPAVSGPGAALPAGRLATLRFLATVIGNALGFAALLTGCWLTLRLLQVLL